MVTHFDHVTVVVRDVDRAKRFFALLGFEEARSVVISGAQIAAYMGVADIEAEHVTLVLPNATPRLEVQLLKYRHPAPLADADSGTLTRVGFNHICFAVADLDHQVRQLVQSGVSLRNEVMEFHDRRLVFLAGPEGITVELAEWQSKAPTQTA